MDVTNAQIMAEVKGIRQDVIEVKEQIEKMNGRQREDHDKITELEARLGIWGGLQATFTAIAALLAGWWGSQR